MSENKETMVRVVSSHYDKNKRTVTVTYKDGTGKTIPFFCGSGKPDNIAFALMSLESQTLTLQEAYIEIMKIYSERAL